MTSLDSASLKFWESVAEWGFRMVFIGVAGEGAEIIAKLFFKKSFKKHEHSWDIFSGICWLILVVGLAIEFKGTHNVTLLSDSENARLTEEAARLNKEAADARLKTASLESRSPGSLPVASIYAVASLEIEKNSVRTLPVKAPYQLGGICTLFFVRNGAVLLALDGESCDVLPLAGKHFLCIIKFRDSSINSWAMPMVESSEPAEKLINEITGFKMIPLCLTEHAKIFGGKVKLVLNGSVIKELQIPTSVVSSFDNGRGWMIKSDMPTNSTTKSP